MDKPHGAKADDKEPYRPPTLTIYGTLRDLTQTTGTTGRNDMFGNNKTGY